MLIVGWADDSTLARRNCTSKPNSLYVSLFHHGVCRHMNIGCFAYVYIYIYIYAR